MSYEKHGLDDLLAHQLVERFPMGAPYTGGKVHGPPLGDLNEKVSTVGTGKFSIRSWTLLWNHDGSSECLLSLSRCHFYLLL